jgi:hypothetical protein
MRYFSIRGLIIVMLATALAACSSAVVMGDYTWVDDNRSGIQDKGERPLAGVDVSLFEEGGDSPITMTTSDKDGHYEFEQVAEGRYFLDFDPPPAYIITVKDQFEDDEVDSDIHPAGNNAGQTDVFSYDGMGDITLDAGFFTGEVATPTPTPAIVIPQPTLMSITPTPADPSGEVEVTTVVKTDLAKHKEYVQLGEMSLVSVVAENDQIELSFHSPGDTPTNISLRGTQEPDGSVNLSGTGFVAARPNISGTFVGYVQVDSTGIVHINGELSLGVMGELPEGQPIIFTITS